MTNEEKIEKKKLEMEKCLEKAKRYQEKAAKIKSDIEKLENLEVKHIIKELNIPISELKTRLSKLAADDVEEKETSYE